MSTKANTFTTHNHMPYVNQDIRRKVKAPLEELIRFVNETPDADRDGTLNYLVSELVTQGMKPATGWRYHYIHRAYGVFIAAGAEFYRRLAGPYEDKAIEKNGDTAGYSPDELHP